MDIRTRCEKEEAKHAASMRRSNERRLLKARQQRLERLLAVPAVLGLVGLIFWITRPMPVEQWYVALASVFLLVPYWTIKYEMEED